LEEAKVDGVINVSVFACGPDSMMVRFVQHRARELEIPFLPLSLDEHSTEGALVTRLEALKRYAYKYTPFRQCLCRSERCGL